MKTEIHKKDKEKEAFAALLERQLQIYDRVIFWNSRSERLLDILLRRLQASGKRYRLYVIGSQERCGALNADADSEVEIVDGAFMDLAEQLYFTYHFSDKVLLFPGNRDLYPSVFNFVESGILTEEEAVEAFLR